MKNIHKFIIAAGVSSLIAVNNPLAHEDSHDHDDERIEHYEAKNPKNKNEALLILGDEVLRVSRVITNEKLSGNDLEAIHEISYSLEAAVDKLRESQTEKTESMLDSLDEAVQAIHYASENHEESKTREWFRKLDRYSKEVISLF